MSSSTDMYIPTSLIWHSDSFNSLKEEQGKAKVAVSCFMLISAGFKIPTSSVFHIAIGSLILCPDPRKGTFRGD